MAFQEGLTSYVPHSWQKTITTSLLIIAPFVFTYTVTYLMSINGIKSKLEGIEAPPVPYTIPFLGNVFSFAFDTAGTFQTIIQKYGSTPVRLRLGPDTIYIISGSTNLSTIFAKSRELSTKALSLLALITAFGMPSSDGKVYEDDDSGLGVKPLPGSNVPEHKRLLHITHHQQNKELSGVALTELSRQFIRFLGQEIKKLDSQLGQTGTELPDIFRFVRDSTFRATTSALCGEKIFALVPDLTEDFWEFDSWLPSILKKLPIWMIPKAFRVRDKNHKNIMKWHAYAKEKVDIWDESLKDVLWEPVWGARIMRLRARMHGSVEEISPAGHAAADLGMIWGANANVIPAIGWALMYIIADPSLTKRILEEITPCFSSTKPESVDLIQLTTCPLLQSVVSETLRVKVAVFINREATIPNFRLSNYHLKPNKIILASTYFEHRNAELWNASAQPLDKFYAERFLTYSDDPNSGPLKTSYSDFKKSANEENSEKSERKVEFDQTSLKNIYVPFGGGTNMCPGRFYAKNELLLAVAMFLYSFEFEYLDVEKFKQTKDNMGSWAVGTLVPDRQNAVRVKRREKKI